MKRKRKIFALVCLSAILYQTFSPLTAFALTSGPASPDASSFEPVDTSTMVNPVTGELVYNVPLMEVPGPEGSYPLSLSYHAGIGPEQESSWVGMGFTLNPGSITRSVNGFPDDWANIQASRRDYWAGGVTTVTSVGVTVPMKFGTINLGLVQVSDTYQGVGYGWNAGVSFGIVKGSPFSVSVGIGSNPFSSGFSLTAGAGFNYKGLGNVGVDASVGENNSVGISVSASYGIMGASLATGSGGFSFSTIGGNSGLSNSKEGIVSTEIRKSSLNLVLFSYSKTRTKYWTDETETSNIFGALNANSFIGLPIPDNNVNDSYNLYEGSVLNGEVPELTQGGAFPAFDGYTVTGQGIGGAIRPYRFQGAMTKQNIYERTATTTKKVVEYGNVEENTTGIGFRFVGDFSNSLLQEYPPFSPDASTIKHYIPPFSTVSAQEESSSFDRYSSITQNLTGSKSITYFQMRSDGAIFANSGKSKFIAPNASGLNRTKHIGTIASGAPYRGIAGFAITNESGITYHYNLPAYNYDEETYQENRKQTNGLRFNRQTKSAGYAYTWHLTAVTGPDYVDRGTIGVLDEADYGYWVSFDYGKWNDGFAWRTPTEGYMDNFDDNFRSVAMGKKEVYYLNSIRTRTHTALFEKDTRLDGKSTSNESFNKVGGNSNYSNSGLYNQNSSQSLRLSHVYIVKNGSFSPLGPSYGQPSKLAVRSRTVACSECELPSNVFDVDDVDAFGRSALEAISLRVIDLNYDYSLAKGSTTSFDYANMNPTVKPGKLTLKSVKLRGKGGVSLLPMTEFGYDLSVADQKKGSGTVNGINITASNVRYEEGDLIETDETSPVYCGFVDRVTPNASDATKFDIIVRGGAGANLGAKNIRKTKNPPFQKDRYDYWGMFKADHFISTANNLNRTPTRNSIRSVDVWSLRRIKTMTGAVVNIGYEGHDFSKSLYSSNNSIRFNTIFNNGPSGTLIYRLSQSNLGNNCERFFKVGDKFNMSFLRRVYVEGSSGDGGAIPRDDFNAQSPVEIVGVNPDNILVQFTSEQLADLYDESNMLQSAFVYACYISPTPLGTNILGGGGVRVKNITLTSIDGIKFETNYSYNKAGSNVSSGSTIYEPLVQEKIPYTLSLSNEIQFTHLLSPGLEESVNFGDELPGPGIMYGRVEALSQVTYPDGAKSLPSERTVSEFYSFSDLKIELKDATVRQSAGDYSTRNLVLRKFISLFGSPKSLSYYDGNGKLIKRVVNQYLHEGITGDFFTGYKTRLQGFGYQGLLVERFSEVKNVNRVSGWVTLGTMTAREDYPLVNIGSVEYDYIHNTKTSTKVNAFDFYSGAVTESISTDSYGNSFLSQSTPAYHDFAAMGPSQLDGTKKNMLTQVSASNVYRLNASGTKEHLVSASYNVWSNGGSVLDGSGNAIVQNSAATNGDVWRQTSGYVWMPSSVAANGMTAVASFVAFPGSNPAGANAAWKRNSDVVLMDTYSHVLSTRDFKNNYVSTRYGYNNAKPVLSGTFAKYGEIAFSGAEDENISNAKKFEVGKGTGTVSTAAFHTGSKSIQLAAGQTGFDYSVAVSELTAARTYTASVWVNNQAAHNVKLYYQLDGVQKTVSAASTVSTKTSGNWTLVTFDITLSGGTTVRVFAKNDGTGTSYVDDFRFHPKNSVSLASVYDAATGELTYSLDRNNLYTRYEYNAMGQLVATYREQFGRTPYKVSETQLNYSTRSFNGLSN